MNKAAAVRDAWRPETQDERDAVLSEMEKILASPHFCNSRRYPALLRYVVENTLDGRSEMLKERTLGVDVFDRSPAYDTNADTVVRYTAGEVRKRLALYYHEAHPKPQIQIALPAGSYVPEFLQHHGSEHEAEHEVAFDHSEPEAVHLSDLHDRRPDEAIQAVHLTALAAAIVPEPNRSRRWHRVLIAFFILLLPLAIAEWHYRPSHAGSALDDFWSPLLRDQKSVLLCSGGVVFKEGNFSGVVTAGKEIEYPFVSSQIAVSISRLSSLLESKGAITNLQFSASTPITTLREQPLILLGGYNNQWTLRLLDQLPLHFAPELNASIVSSTDTHMFWARDQTLPYSSADDYALIARFRNTTTDSWIVVLAGLGRNGTEAAGQFVTNPRYMQVLKDRVGAGLLTRNIEAVLQVNVIDGKTGAPSLVAVQTW